MQKKKSIRSLINENVVDLYSSKEFKNLSDVEKSVVISTLKRIKKNDDLGESYQDVFKAFNYMTYDPFYFNNIWPLKDKLYQLSELYWKARKEEEKEDEKLLSDTEREMCKNSPVFKGWLIQAHKEIEKKAKSTHALQYVS